jgi:hypothetical protein
MNSRTLAAPKRQEDAVATRLLPLAERADAGAARRSVVELDDGRIVLVENGQPYLVGVRPAPDGEYPLLLAGRLVVKSGRAIAVEGRPAAPAFSAPSE